MRAFCCARNGLMRSTTTQCLVSSTPVITPRLYVAPSRSTVTGEPSTHRSMGLFMSSAATTTRAIPAGRSFNSDVETGSSTCPVTTTPSTFAPLCRRLALFGRLDRLNGCARRRLVVDLEVHGHGPVWLTRAEHREGGAACPSEEFRTHPNLTHLTATPAAEPLTSPITVKRRMAPDTVVGHTALDAGR
jgi:hypothetical protein